MPTLCEKCPKRDACVELCCDAEVYADLDSVKPKEKLIGRPQYSQPWPELPGPIHLTPREKEIVTLLGLKLDRADVCQILGISRDTLRKHIQRLKEKSHAFIY